MIDFIKINALENFKKKLLELEDLRITTYIGLPGSAKSLFIREIVSGFRKIVLFCSTEGEAHELLVELNLLGMEKLLVEFVNFSDESIQEKLTELTRRNDFILISTYSILKIKLPPERQIDKNTTILEPGGEISYDDLIEYLLMLNYTREKYVDSPGDFAVRGSIIDFWSYSEKQPCRVEYDGDFIESIRYFDPENQRSWGRSESVTLAAAIESYTEEEYSTIFDYIEDSLVFAESYELNNIAEGEEETREIENISDTDIDEELKAEFFDSAAPNKKNEKSNNIIYKNIDTLFENKVKWLIELSISTDNATIDTDIERAPVINSNFQLLFKTISDFSQKDYKIIITAENELQANRLKELLSEYKKEFSELIDSGIIKIKPLAIREGFVSRSDKLTVLTDYRIFNKPYRTQLFSKRRKKKSTAKELASLKRGDFVVHENFGIGRYDGLETIKIGEIKQESIKIIYAEGGVVYVNLNYLGLVKKYSSKENAAPRLSVLGGNEWKNRKKKVKSKIKDAARDLITLYAKRKSTEGITFGPDTVWQKELEASFLYEDTPDQSEVTEAVKSDMESVNPMDRLVCGDVGFGKTEIAVRAAFKAVQDGFQVAMLVPTTILAQQHFNTFKDRLTQFPVNVAAISRFQTKKEQSKILENLAAGKIDVIIGTHRLLSKDLIFNNLGLLIIDEEHRFGVMAKEKLRQFKVSVDTLTLTATPIPRTLNLSLLGARDLSLISTPPPNRQPIYTSVETFDIHKVRRWVLNETARGGQIYFVHDRVQSIEKIAAYIHKHIPEINIAVAHGKLKSSQLEKVIYDFLNKKYQMLISTKIIESGIDIPNVNTIIINRADRFGLAELHQLRGRVGRSQRQAYAFLLVPSLNTISKKAVRRLQAIEEYTALGEGFNLAMRDLEIRGAGNLIGTEQSGVIDSVGFDLYVKLLDEAVEELKKDEFSDIFKELPKQKERSEPTIDTFFEIGIPKSFMPDQADRLSYYTALFTILKVEEADEIREEMTDKFGKIPVIIERLIQTAILRFYASFSLFERIVIRQNKIDLILPKADNEEFYKNRFTLLMEFIVEKYSGIVQFKQGRSVMKLELINNFDSPEDTLKYLQNFCREVSAEVIDKNLDMLEKELQAEKS